MTSLLDRERRFADRIDCCFPHNDAVQATALIREAVSISSNMAFAVLAEICQPPRDGLVLQSRQLALIDEWAAAFSHPLSPGILEYARRHAHGGRMPLTWALEMMRQIEAHHGQYAALNIAYCAAECASDEEAAKLDELDNAIRQRWERD